MPAPAPALKAPCWHGWYRCWAVLAAEIAAGVREQGGGVRSPLMLASRVQPRSGGAAEGETSRIGAVGRFPPAAEAGRLVHPINSSIWACTETSALVAAIRSAADRLGSEARSSMSRADRRRRSAIWPGSDARAKARATPDLRALRVSDFPSCGPSNLSMSINSFMDSVIKFGHQKNEGLTRKAVYATLALHGMKNETKQRLKAAAIAALIATAILALGLIESALGLTPNH